MIVKRTLTSLPTSRGPPPSVTEPSSAMSPGCVSGGSVAVSGGGPREVGRDVSVRFTITNSGGQPVALEGIRLAVRGPDGAGADLVSDQAVTLAPGQPLPVSASWPLDTVGPWHGWIEVVQNGAPSLVGEKQAFAFRVSLPRDLVVRRWIMAEAGLSSQS